MDADKDYALLAQLLMQVQNDDAVVIGITELLSALARRCPYGVKNPAEKPEIVEAIYSMLRAQYRRDLQIVGANTLTSFAVGLENSQKFQYLLIPSDVIDQLFDMACGEGNIFTSGITAICHFLYQGLLIQSSAITIIDVCLR